LSIERVKNCYYVTFIIQKYNYFIYLVVFNCDFIWHEN